MKTDDDIKVWWVYGTLPLDTMVAVFTFLDFAMEYLHLDEDISRDRLDQCRREYQATGIISERVEKYLTATASAYQRDITFTVDDVLYLREAWKVAWE